MTHPTLLIENLSHSYGSHEVFRDVTIERDQPGVIAIHGKNGSGKSTLLKIVAQMVRPASGAFSICGHSVTDGDSEAARRLTGWVPHTPLAFASSSVERNLRQAARMAGLPKSPAATRARQAIDAWQLDGVATAPVRQLSRGWTQRYALARADLLRPPILLLDEVSAGLDEPSRQLLDGAITSWARDRIILLTSHDRNWLDHHANQHLWLSDKVAANV